MKKKFIKLYFIPIVLLSTNVFSQNPDPAIKNSEDYRFGPEGNELFLSPDVAAFQKYNFFDVNLYVGKLDTSIPFYTIEEGNIKIPISISYNSGGIKVDEIASSVGIGWNLNAGGNVIRAIKNIEDNQFLTGLWTEVERGDIDEYTKQEYRYVTTKGFFRSEDEQSEPPYNGITNIKGLANEDASPDLFTAIAPGLNTKFILNKKKYINNAYEGFFSVQFLDGNGNLARDVERKRTLNFSYFGFDNRTIYGAEGIHKIYGDNNRPIGTPWMIGSEKRYYIDYEQFILTNTSGIEYIFSQPDINESIPNFVPQGWSSPASLPISIMKMIFNIQKSHTVTTPTWNLTNIKDNENNRQVTFEYEQYSKPTVYKIRNNSNDVLREDANPGKVWSSAGRGIYAFGHIPDFQDKTYVNVEEVRTKNQFYYSKDTRLNRLKKIKWSYGEIEFIYGLVRQDNYDNEKALTEIIIRNKNGQKVKHFKLSYSYFNSKENCSQWQCKRLKLDNIVQVNNDNKIDPYYKLDYYYDHPLPKVNSLQQDFLGYYNNNGKEKTDELKDYISPILYYHKNQGRYSILPFQRNDGTFTKLIPGQFSLAPNNYSLSGLLKKITFPTGGTSEFEYENHKFIFNEREYLAGGARIKKQILNDDNGSRRVLNYEYLQNGVSSGVVNNFPTYAYPWGYNTNKTSDNVSFIAFDKPKNNIELTSGSYVGYSNIKVYENGNGFTEYSFSSNKQFPNEYDKYIGTNGVINSGAEQSGYVPSTRINFLINNSSYPDLNYIDNDLRRAKLLFKKEYDSNNILNKETTFDYEYKLFENIPLKYQVSLDNYYPSDAYTPQPNNDYIGFTSNLRVERNLLSKQETKEYLAGGVVSNIKEMTYDAVYPFVKQEKTINSKDEILITDNEYVFERTDELSKRLTNHNRVSEPLRTVYKNGDHIISSTYNHYSDFNGIIRKAHILQKSKALVEYSDADARKISYESFDKKGNVTQYALQNGIPVAIIWGYNGQYPIAKIEGAAYSEVSAYISDLEIASNNNKLSTSSFSNIINGLPNAMVTGYIYKPLVGVTQIIQPNGITEFYKYDEFGRLVEIKNNKGEVIKTFEYNYKN